jgi:hypothetical protein
MIRCIYRMYEKYNKIYFLGEKDLSSTILFKSSNELEEPNINEGFKDIKIIDSKKLTFDDYNNKCIFLDIDGILRRTDHLKNKYPINKEEIELLFNVDKMKNILNKYKK